MYSYFGESVYTAFWFALWLSPYLIYLVATKRRFQSVPLVAVFYLLVACWAEGAFTEAYKTKQIVGYAAATRDTSGQGFFGGNGVQADPRAHTPCQQPVYAHEDRGYGILWLAPLAGAAFALFYDLANGTRHATHTLMLFLPFLFLAYLLIAAPYMVEESQKPCDVVGSEVIYPAYGSSPAATH